MPKTAQLWIPGVVGFRHVLIDAGLTPEVFRDVIDRASRVGPAHQEQHPLGFALGFLEVGAAVPTQGHVGDVGPFAVMRIGPFKVTALDLLQVVLGFADMDVAAQEIRIVLGGFLLLEEPGDVVVGDVQWIGHGLMGIAADAD